MRKRRSNISNRSNQDNVTQSPDSVTLDVTQYPAILKSLVDPDKRAKLEKIYQSLRDFKQEKSVFYGYPGMIPFDEVGGLLETTR